MSIPHGIKTLGVIGAGQMGKGAGIPPETRKLTEYIAGLGIAFVSALRAKVPVLLHDRYLSQLRDGLALMDKLLAKDVSKGKISQADATDARQIDSFLLVDVGIVRLSEYIFVFHCSLFLQSLPLLRILPFFLDHVVAALRQIRLLRVLFLVHAVVRGGDL